MDEPGKVAMWQKDGELIMGLMDHDVIEYEGKFVPVVRMPVSCALEVAQVLLKQSAAALKKEA